MVSNDDLRTNGLDTPVTLPPSYPGKESALYVVNHPKLHRGAAPCFTVVHVSCVP